MCDTALCQPNRLHADTAADVGFAVGGVGIGVVGDVGVVDVSVDLDAVTSYSYYYMVVLHISSQIKSYTIACK